jgi:hypothetical protein
VGGADSISLLYDHARSLGLPADKMDVTGKAHNPENAEFVPEFLNLLRRNPTLFRLPKNNRLQVPVRSNRTGDELTDDFIMEDLITMMLAAYCDWYGLVSRVAEDMKASGQPSHHIVIFGMNDSVPLSPFNKKVLFVAPAAIVCRDCLPSEAVGLLHFFITLPFGPPSDLDRNDNNTKSNYYDISLMRQNISVFHKQSPP